jgi:translation elongation factor EF-G
MAAKVELLRQAEDFSPVADKTENLHALKDFQRKWMEIGHVPIKEKDRLQAEFRKAIDKLMDRLNITNLDMNAVNFKNRFEGMKDAPEGQRTILKEISFLQGKIQKMSEDMSVWENNIGFLANSKNANLLKEEFEKKIEKARLEIRLLEAKVKFLRDELNK